MPTGTLKKLVALKPGLNQKALGDIAVGQEFTASPGAATDLIARGMAKEVSASRRRPPAKSPPPLPAADPPREGEDSKVTEGGE